MFKFSVSSWLSSAAHGGRNLRHRMDHAPRHHARTCAHGWSSRPLRANGCRRVLSINVVNSSPSGVAEVISFLNGARPMNLLGYLTFLGKAIGVTLAVGAGVYLGFMHGDPLSPQTRGSLHSSWIHCWCPHPVAAVHGAAARA